jgi:outer membrane protease
MRRMHLLGMAVSLWTLTVVCTSAQTFNVRVTDAPGVNAVEPPSAQPAADNRAVTFELWGGLGAMSGDVTYQIGGLYSDEAGTVRENFPISELSWPIDVASGTVGCNVNIARYVEIAGQWSGNLSPDAGKSQDSDWEDPQRPGMKTTFSLCDTHFNGYTADIALRCWVLNWVWDPRTGYACGLGVGYMYQDFRWDDDNLDQWYPANPDLGHDTEFGTVASYKAETSMPYIELSGEMRMPWMSFYGSLGYSPSAQVKDEDDHKVRYILAKTDADGDAVKMTLQGRYDYSQYMFALIRADFMSYDVDGTEHDLVYAGNDVGQTWTIDHRITSVQENITLALGLKF